MDLCAKLNVINNVEFRGTQGREYIANEMNKSIAFVLTSVSEGFPKVVIESMATGTPVISTNVGCVANVIGDGGLIVESKNVDAIYEAMKRIVDDKSLWEKCSTESENRSKEYSWENHVSKLQNVYKNLLNGGEKTIK